MTDKLFKKLEDKSFHCTHCGGDNIMVSHAKEILADTLRENDCLHAAIENLRTISEQDWHGKWRIQKALDALNPSKESGNGK